MPKQLPIMNYIQCAHTMTLALSYDINKLAIMLMHRDFLQSYAVIPLAMYTRNLFHNFFLSLIDFYFL